MTKHKITAIVDEGDDGYNYAIIRIGQAVVLVYESQVRPGGITVEVDTPANVPADFLAVYVDDQER